ncbi:unnamed protein product [Rhizophagus irregularis]|nr:unnamed protein product [Rhizophagus irregularis]
MDEEKTFFKDIGTHLPFPVKAGKRTLNDIKDLIQYVFSLNICYGQSTTGLEDVTYELIRIQTGKSNGTRYHPIL